MRQMLQQTHRFALSQMFYPLLLSSMLALATFAGRVYLSRNPYIYLNLVWNLILAWLPYLFSMFAAGLHRRFPGRWLLLTVPGALWLLFFPNGPYILTDFLHLEQRPYVPLWYDILLLGIFAWTGLFLAIGSLRSIQTLIKYYFGAIISWLFAGLALGMAGLGIYLGRFERWNSWDFFFHPKRIVADISYFLASPSENLRFFGFTLLITAFLAVCYLTFISFNPIHEPQE